MENQKSVLDDPENIKILDQVKGLITHSIKRSDLRYKFDEGLNDSEFLEDYESRLNNVIKSYSQDAKITKSINETNWPDALVLSLLIRAGYEANSINDFKKITKVITYNKETKTIQLSLIPTLRADVTRAIIDLEVKPEYTCNGEVIECE